MIYVLVFFLSAIFAFCAQNVEAKGIKIVLSRGKRYSLANLFMILSALGPILLGSFRSVNIGSDNYVYQIRFESISNIENIKVALEYGNLDFGFNFLMYIVSRISDNYNLFCFFTSLITYACVLFAFWKLRKKVSLPMIILTYLFLYYCNMYNLMRQGVSLAICFLAFTYLLESKMIMYLILVIISCLIHSSSFVFLAAWPLYKYLDADKYTSKGNSKKFLLRGSLIVFITVIVTLSWEQILNALVSIGILGVKYLDYLSFSENINIPYRQIILFAILLFIIVLLRPYMAFKYKDYNFICIMGIIGFIFTLLSIHFTAMGRIGLYFFYPLMININSISITFDRNNRLVFDLLLLIFLIIFWYLLTVSNGYGYAFPVYPYVSIFQE